MATSSTLQTTPRTIARQIAVAHERLQAAQREYEDTVAPLYVDFGCRIAQARMRLNWTQEMVAARLGIDRSLVSAFECGVRRPSQDILLRLADLFAGG